MENFPFVGGWKPGVDQTERFFEPVRCGGCASHDPFGEKAGRFHPGRIVQGREGVQGRTRPTGFDPAGLAVGRVEHVDRADGSSPEGVEAAAVQVVTLGGGVFETAVFRHAEGFPDFFGLIGKNGRSPQAIDQQTGVGEGPVAKDHGGQAKTAGPADETVFRIVFALPVVHFTGLPIGRARDDQPVHFLLAPTQILEFHGQPVQEIEVKGVLALHAEIFGGFDQADSEKPLPHPVDLDAGGQGLFAGKQPF